MADLATHAMQHFFRSWMDATGAAPTIQQKGMRHWSLAITMQYGDADRDLLQQLLIKVRLWHSPRPTAGQAAKC